MKTILLVTFFLYATLGYTKSPATLNKFNKDWSYYSAVEIEEFRLLQKLEKRNKDYRNLKLAKKNLINGNLEMAEYYLRKVNELESRLGMIKQRYQSTIEFIKGNFANSHKLISSERYNDVRYYPEICMLRVMNLLALEDIKAFDNELRSCSNLTYNYSMNEQFWLTNFGDVKKRDKGLIAGTDIESMKNILGSKEYIKMWLKLGIYLNKEQVLMKYISKFPEKTYRSKKIRELIALVHYRIGDKKKALSFIEDIDSPNADNIRGNISLEEKKYELAFGHFKLALNKKQNSINALERAIPLSWMLEQWEDGLNLLNRVINKKLDEKKKLAINTAFLIELEKFDKSRKQLNLLEVKFKKKVPLEIDLMNSYVALRRGNKEKVTESSSKACRRFDGLNCWIKMQQLTWENLGLTINREEDIFTGKSYEIDSLKAAVDIKPMKETIVIDQKDIEELDSTLVEINPDIIY